MIAHIPLTEFKNAWITLVIWPFKMFNVTEISKNIYVLIWDYWIWLNKNSHGKSVGNSESWIQFCIYGFGLGGGGLDGAFFWGIIWDDFPSDGIDSVGFVNEDSNPKPPAGAESNAFHGSLLEIIKQLMSHIYESYFKQIKARLTNHPKSKFYFRCHSQLKTFPTP